MKMKKSKFKVGLALGGGGARGLAHIGVLKVFQAANIPIDLIVGTSMGAIIGSAYALTLDASVVEKMVLDFLSRKEVVELESFAATSAPEEKRLIIENLVGFIKKLFLWNMRAIKGWLVDGEKIEVLIRELLRNGSFNQTKIPFASVATDLKRGGEVILNQGDLTKAILASSALPGVFSPIEIGGRTLVDGSIVSVVPIEAARTLGADFVIAVNVEGELTAKEFKHGIDVLFQADAVKGYELNRMKLKLADFVIEPKMSHISWASFSKGRSCIKMGEKAALEAVRDIERLIARQRKRKVLRKVIPSFLSFPQVGR